MKVFYSWQLDANRKVNKDLIHDALADAIAELNREISITNAERNSEIELDQDTKGVLGSPQVAQTIFDKIRSTDVFVADVTLVAKGKEDKLHINSNVAIELGFLLGCRGSEPIIKVMNTAYGKPEQLPFDLNDRRWPTMYELEESADKAEIKSVRKDLANRLLPILKLHIKAAEIPKPKKALYAPVTPTYCASAFWQEGSPIVDGGSATKTFRCDSDKLVAVRIIPKSTQLQLTRADCNSFIQESAPMINMGGIFYRTNEWGAIAFTTEHQTNNIASATQLFREREIWCFTEGLIHSRESDDEGENRWLIDKYALMEYLPDGIAIARELAKNIGLTEFNGQIIASDLTGVSVPPLNHRRGTESQLYDRMVLLEFDDKSSLLSDELAYKFTQQIYGEAGIKLPPSKTLER